MTIMKKSDDKFNEEWRDAFEGAEMQPPAQVWSSIESGLSSQEVGRYRKKIFIYKWLVAATMIFAVGFGLFTWYAGRGPGETSGELAANEKPTNDLPDKKGDNQPDNALAMGEQEEISTDTPEEDRKVYQPDGSIFPAREKIANQPDKGDKFNGFTVEEGYPEERINIKLPIKQGGKFRESPIAWIEIEVPEKKSNPYEAIDEWMHVQDKSDFSREGEVWAGVNLASGVFDPNINYGPRPTFLGSVTGQTADAAESLNGPNSNMSRSSPPEQTGFNPEFSYSYGLSMGYGLSEKFVLMGGVSYLYNATSTTVNSYIESTGTNRKFANQFIFAQSVDLEGISSFNTSSQAIPLNNIYEFVSVPINVGYYLINREVQWMVSTGISTDFLLKNTIYDPAGNLESAELFSGDDSPYKSTYLNGILGTSVDYTFNDHYLIRVAPAYRMGLSYLTRDEAVFNSRPSAFYISAGISYIIK